MAQPVTPADWLPILESRLTKLRPRIARLRRYGSGEPDLPEMSHNARATWLAFQKKARVDFGGIAIRSHVNRIRYRGVQVGDNPESDESLAALRIARNNRLPTQIRAAVRDMTATSTGYLVGYAQPGRQRGEYVPVIQAEPPEWFYAEPDPMAPWRARAALKIWRDDIAKHENAMVWAGAVWQHFERDANASTFASPSAWSPAGEVGSTPGWTAPPVSIFTREDVDEQGLPLALIEPHLDLIDRIVQGKLERLSTAAIQAFKQRGLKKEEGVELPSHDPVTGAKINYEELFAPAPGALWDLPAGVDIWESSATDIRPMLEAEKADAREFSAVTGTPVSMLQPDSANQSATGAAATTAQQADACDSDIDRIKIGVEARILDALRLVGVPAPDTIDVTFENPRWVTLAEKMDAYSKAVAGSMSVESAQAHILGWSPQQIREDRANRQREQSLAALVALTDG